MLCVPIIIRCTGSVSVANKSIFNNLKRLQYNFANKMSVFNNVLYSNLKSLLDVLEPKAETNLHVKDLLNIFHEALVTSKKFSSSDENKHPFIILEGLDGSGKSTMTKQLSKRIKAQKWQTPPNSVKHLRFYFDNDPDLRTAFYQLGNYIAALEVSCLLYDSPIVMDRYWHSTAAYAIAQAVSDNPESLKMPKKGDPIYNWPSDLLKPHIVLFLSVNEENRVDRHSRRAEITDQEKLLKDSLEFRQNVIDAYKNMTNPSVEIINTNQGFMKTVYSLLDKVTPLLKK